MKRVIILLLSILLSGCGTSLSSNSIDAPNIENTGARCSLSLHQQIDQLAQPQIDSGHTPGMVVGIITADGQQQIFSYGYTDTDRLIPVDGDTLFAVGSISKGFTAESAALLVQHGQLSWQDTLGQLLPRSNKLSPDARRITVEQLASHTSGLPRQVSNIAMLDKLVYYLFTGAPFYGDLDSGDYNDFLRNFHTLAQGKVIYSNLGYALLDQALEQHSGRPVPQLVNSLILQPLAMKHSGYYPQLLPGYIRRARGHAGDQPKFVARGEVVPEWHFSGYMMGAASLWSSAGDLLKYLSAHLHASGNPTRDRAFADAMRMRLYASDDDSAALGWLGNHIYGQDIIYQSGFIGGYASYIGMDRRHGNAIVVLQNSFNWDNDIGHRMLLRMAQAADNPGRCD